MKCVKIEFSDTMRIESVSYVLIGAESEYAHLRANCEYINTSLGNGITYFACAADIAIETAALRSAPQ